MGKGTARGSTAADLPTTRPVRSLLFDPPDRHRLLVQMLEQERRLVTVLFADMVGFTALADELDPELLQELVSGIFEALAEEAIRYDGTIEKFIGDAIFVIFGAPIAHEDDPQRALRTALAMQHVFTAHAARLQKERGITIGLRIGVHTGLVVAGGGVRSGPEYGVMGDTVNIASRLQSAAGAGEIYVTQATFRFTNREFSFREVGPITMKGKEQPVLAYALASERTEARERLELNAPLVGRWMELSRLDLAYQSARIGRTEVVLVAGEAGIGKSRLLAEFVGLTDSAEGAGPAELPRVLRWTFSRVNQRSYAGFVEPLRDALDVDPASPDAVATLKARLAAMGFPSPTMPELLAQFLRLSGAPQPENESDEWKRSLYIAVFDLLAGLARERPLLYVLEDLHFADSASLDLLWFVATRPSRVPMLFLLAQRLGQGAPEPRPSRTNFSQIVLEPLTNEEASRIVESALDWAPDALRDRIVSRAGGNPFFIEESIRSLVESGAVARDEGGEWRMRDAASALEVPATLHAVIAARIDRLPPAAKESLQLASVIGQRFGDRVLREAGGTRLAEAVDTLIAADLVVEAAPGERREGRYRFKHAVTQEVAYNTLLVRRRAELHRRVAAAMEKVLGDEVSEFAPALAHHYLLGEDQAKAADYSWKAAESALAIHAHVEAIRFGEQALELYEKLGNVSAAVEAVYLIGRVRRYRGETDQGLAVYERALALLEGANASAAEKARLIASMGELCTRWGAKHPDLAGLIAKGLELAGPAPSRERARLLAARAFAPRRQPTATDLDWEESLGTAQEALAIAEELGLFREVSLCLDAVGYAERELGRFRDALAAHRRRLPIAESLQDSDELIDAHTMVSQAALVMGDPAEATAHATAARELASETEKPRLGMHAVEAEALAHLVSGEFFPAVAAAAGIDLFAAGLWDRPATQVMVIAMAAAAALTSDEEQRYRERLREGDNPSAVAAGDLLSAIYGQRESASAYRAARSAGWPNTIVNRVLWGPLVVLAAARWGIEDEAHDELVAATIERTGHARGRALLVQAQGLRALRQGENARAEKLLFDATQAFASLQLDHERAVASVDHAQALRRLGRDVDATMELDEARHLAEHLQANALLSTIAAVVVPA
ncbi:MAG: hypothetical protein EXR61_05765 [Chloroflexi bacterium]|nr:hypothetical protein [Chloroflexota bacterium]